MKTYKITTYGGGLTYTVSLDDDGGVVSANGLSGLALGSLKTSVARHMNKHGLPATVALGLAVGPYSSVEVAAEASVSDPAGASEVS